MKALSIVVEDEQLIKVAKDTIRELQKYGKHHIGAALRTKSGRILTAVHLEANVGRVAVCAEAIVIGKAISEGENEFDTIVGVRHPRPNDEIRKSLSYRARAKAVFTGVNAPEFRGEIIGENYVVIGNLLTGKEVMRNIATEFERSCASLALRLVNALKAGSEIGGDRRGEKSAALIVVDTERVKMEIKIDRQADPVGELFRRLSQ